MKPFSQMTQEELKLAEQLLIAEGLRRQYPWLGEAAHKVYRSRGKGIAIGALRTAIRDIQELREGRASFGLLDAQVTIEHWASEGNWDRVELVA